MASLGPHAWMDQVQQAQMAPRGQLHANAGNLFQYLLEIRSSNRFDVILVGI